MLQYSFHTLHHAAEHMFFILLSDPFVQLCFTYDTYKHVTGQATGNPPGFIRDISTARFRMISDIALLRLWCES